MITIGQTELTQMSRFASHDWWYIRRKIAHFIKLEANIEIDIGSSINKVEFEQIEY